MQRFLGEPVDHVTHPIQRVPGTSQAAPGSWKRQPLPVHRTRTRSNRNARPAARGKGCRTHDAGSGLSGPVVSDSHHFRTRIVTVSPSAITISASYVGGFPGGYSLSPRLVNQRPIAADLNSGQVVQKVGETSQSGCAAWPGS